MRKPHITLAKPAKVEVTAISRSGHKKTFYMWSVSGAKELR
jgi:hypothetical protein